MNETTLKLFGVYKNGPEADRAIRQLLNSEIPATKIWAYSHNQNVIKAIKEAHVQGLDAYPMDDESLLVQQGYQEGDIILYTSQTPEDHIRDAQGTHEANHGTTTAEVQREVAEEKEQER